MRQRLLLEGYDEDGGRKGGGVDEEVNEGEGKEGIIIISSLISSHLLHYKVPLQCYLLPSFYPLSPPPSPLEQGGRRERYEKA